MFDFCFSGCQVDQLCEVCIECVFICYVEGLVLVSFGEICVLCIVSVENCVLGFLCGKGEGWVMVEYGMLLCLIYICNDCEVVCGKQGGCMLEIQCLIGCILCVCIDCGVFGECIIILDCDVLQVDGGICIVVIIGVYVVLVDVVNFLFKCGDIKCNLIVGVVVVVFVGVYCGILVLDLDYVEDSDCDIDMNVVMNDGGGFIELQGIVEGYVFCCDELDVLLVLVEMGIQVLFVVQQVVLVLV